VKKIALKIISAHFFLASSCLECVLWHKQSKSIELNDNPLAMPFEEENLINLSIEINYDIVAWHVCGYN